MYLVILLLIILLLFNKNIVEKFSRNVDKSFSQLLGMDKDKNFSSTGTNWDIPIKKNFDIYKNEYEQRYRKQNILDNIDKNLNSIKKNIHKPDIDKLDNIGIDNLTEHSNDSKKKIEKPVKIEKDILEDISEIPDLNYLKKKYKEYQDQECDFTKWIENPERCKAAKNFNIQLSNYISDDLKVGEKEFENSFNLHSSIPKIDKNIYPINNYDFNYVRNAKNKYNIYNQGITNKPTVDAFKKNSNKLKTYIDSFFKEEFINDNTISGMSDIKFDNKNQVYLKNRYNQLNSTLPYLNFRNDYPENKYPTKGRNSTSYFVRSGTCPTNINSKNTCENKGYYWNKINKSDGICNKPRFMYIDNSNQSTIEKGIFSSMKEELNVISDDFYNFQHEDPIKLHNKIGLLPCIDS